ncbi:hypothetical protein RRG08_040382 [Elysia crispata]|uniref:Uncharacterized protein n=1 Tax=Elysia crispata TaxID=231223 RepID=A0AAE1A1Q9_9GAST|nr:hypothetical protein RRG08_040382 [Elysia crispata]
MWIEVVLAMFVELTELWKPHVLTPALWYNAVGCRGFWKVSERTFAWLDDPSSLQMRPQIANVGPNLLPVGSNHAVTNPDLRFEPNPRHGLPLFYNGVWASDDKSSLILSLGSPQHTVLSSYPGTSLWRSNNTVIFMSPKFLSESFCGDILKGVSEIADHLYACHSRPSPRREGLEGYSAKTLI